MPRNRDPTIFETWKNIIYYYPYARILDVWNISKFYIMWSVLHIIVVKLYHNQCVPNTTLGMIFTPILMSTPHCRGMMWIINTASTTVYYMTQATAMWMGYRLINMCQGHIPAQTTTQHSTQGHQHAE
jgi:hypothetical protein